MSKVRNYQRGASLVEILLVIGIMGIVSVAIFQLFDTNNRMVNNTRLKMDRQSIVLDMQARVVCPSLTAIASTCTTPGKLVTLKDKSGNELIRASGTTYGNFTVRAECTTSRDAYIIRLTRLSSSGTVTSTSDSHFSPDPLTSTIIKWSDPRSLGLVPGINFCPNSSGGATTWVAMEYDGAYKIGWQLFSIIKGNLSPDDYCISKGFRGAGGECKHDNIEPLGYSGQDWGAGFHGQSSYQATRFAHAPFNGRWSISCPSHYWQKPDFITCNN